MLTYGLVNMLPQLTAAILAIAYTRIFSPAWYGAYGVLAALMAILAVLGDLGLSQAILRNYYDRHQDEDEARRYLSSVLLGSRLLSLPALAVGGIAMYWAWPRLGVGSPVFILPLLAFAFFDRASNSLAMVCRAMEKPGYFSIGIAAQSAATLTGAFVLVYLMRLGIPGVLFTALAGRMASWFCYLFVVRRRLHVTGGNLDWPEILSCLKFGFPLLVNRGAGWGRQLGLRPVLLQAVPLQSIGLFSFAGAVANVPSLISGAIELALSPIYFKRRAEGIGEFRQRLLKFGLIFSGLMFPIWVVALVLSPWAIRLVAARYRGAVPACVLLLCAAFVRIHFPFFMRQIQFLRVTWFVPLASIPAALFSMGLTLVLASSVGMIGAAWAVLATDIGLLLAFAAAIRRYEALDYPLLALVLQTAALILIALWITLGEPVPDNLPKLLVQGLVVFGAGFFVLGVCIWPNRALLRELAEG